MAKRRLLNESYGGKEMPDADPAAQPADGLSKRRLGDAGGNGSLPSPLPPQMPTPLTDASAPAPGNMDAYLRTGRRVMSPETQTPDLMALFKQLGIMG